MLLADCHMHSLFSTDSEAPMEEMVEAAAAKGLETVCFTNTWIMITRSSRERKGRLTFSWIFRLTRKHSRAEGAVLRQGGGAVRPGL